MGNLEPLRGAAWSYLLAPSSAASVLTTARLPPALTPAGQRYPTAKKRGPLRDGGGVGM